MYDFGVFGKWSKKTLIAQSEWSDGIISPPDLLRGEYDRALEKIGDLKYTKIKNLTLQELKDKYDELTNQWKIINQYREIESLCIKLNDAKHKGELK